MCRHIRCLICGEETTKAESTPIRHTTGTRYACPRCARNIRGYTQENPVFLPSATQGTFTMSKEFEIPTSARAYTTIENINATMRAYKWLPTSDGTVWVECKSAIYQNMNAYVRVLKSLEEKLGFTRWAEDNTFGTHTNVWTPGYDVEIVRLFYHSLFMPLSETLRAYGDMCREVFGRYIGGWAEPIYNNTWILNHTNFINVQHDGWLEFRINKCVSVAQDIRATKLCIEITQAVSAFCEKVKENRRTLTGDELRAANKRDADKAARKIVNLFRKVAGLGRINATAR